MLQSSLSEFERDYLLIACCVEPESLIQTISYLPDRFQTSQLVSAAQELGQRSSHELQKIGKEELAKIKGVHPLLVTDLPVHPEVLARVLSHENPILIGNVLAELAPEVTSMILDCLPEHILERLPVVSDSQKHSGLNQYLVEVLCRHLAGQYALQDESLPPIFLKWLNLGIDALENTILELGYCEIALSLSSVPQEVQAQVLSRMGVRERTRIDFYRVTMSHDPERIKKAQMHLVSCPQNQHNQARDFVLQLGILVLAKALTEDEYVALLPYLQNKLSTQVSQRLIEQFHQVAKQQNEHNQKLMRISFEDVMKVVCP